MTAAQPPTGDRIASEVEREMQENLYRLRHVVLAPSEYHVYLHPEDFRQIELVVPRIVHDVQTCLNDLVKRLNARTTWSRFIGSSTAPIEIPAGGWAVHIKPALNNETAPGELGIHSRLSVPLQATFGSGAGTVRITQTVVSATNRHTVLSEEPTASPQPDQSARPTSGPNPGTAGPRLNYSDESGAHVYVIAKDLIKIGRGGEAHWVDITLTTGTNVSREHCHVRRDPTGRFWLRDVSAWGTRLNGQLLIKYAEGDVAAAEYELADGASIQLADAVVLEFRLR